MKRAPPAAKVLLRCLNARQFGLKLIANVTYGYTAAGFSGGQQQAHCTARHTGLAARFTRRPRRRPASPRRPHADG